MRKNGMYTHWHSTMLNVAETFQSMRRHGLLTDDEQERAVRDIEQRDGICVTATKIVIVPDEIGTLICDDGIWTWITIEGTKQDDH